MIKRKSTEVQNPHTQWRSKYIHIPVNICLNRDIKRGQGLQHTYLFTEHNAWWAVLGHETVFHVKVSLRMNRLLLSIMYIRYEVTRTWEPSSEFSFIKAANNDWKPCVMLMHCIVNILQCSQTCRHKATRGYELITSAVLHLTNQFSEFYHNGMNAMQGFASLREPSLILKHIIPVFKEQCFLVWSCNYFQETAKTDRQTNTLHIKLYLQKYN